MQGFVSPHVVDGSHRVVRRHAKTVKKRNEPQRKHWTPLVACSARVSRRHVNRLLLTNALLLGPVNASLAATSAVSSGVDDLRTRLAKKIPARPRNGLTKRDLIFPDYCLGTWRVSSTLAAVCAPAGYKLFGRTGALEKAIEGIGETVDYNARFVRSPLGVVPDREYNVVAIADATMGRGAVLHCGADGSDRLSVTVRPRGADGAAFVVSTRVSFRAQQDAEPPTRVGGADAEVLGDMLMRERSREGRESLFASEMVRQTVIPDSDSIRAKPLVKDVETTTVLFAPDENGFNALQRTATYLTKDDLRYVDAKGAPVDLRSYRLRYSPL